MHYSFSLGTLLVPHFMHFLGRFYLSTTKLSWLPLSPFRIFLSRAPPDKIGYSASQARYLALMFASLLPPTSFIMMGSRSGFPCMFMAYVVVSFGRAILTAPLNMFLSSLPSKPLGYAFGMWGFGAVVSPLIFQVTAAAGIPWTHFYFGSLVLPAINIVFLGMTYMPTPKEFGKDRKIALDAADSRDQRSHSLTPDLDDGVPELTTTSLKIAPANQLRLCLSMPYQWAVSIFVLFYCGSETTTQGLVVQYLLAERSANPNAVGYVTSGFWAGISASRVAWSYFSPRITFTARKYIIQGCLGFALAMHLFIWFINSGVENAFSTSLIGVVYGPLFPASLELANDLLPVEVNMVSMAIMYPLTPSCIAVFPFITGVVTTHYTMRCWSYITAAQTSILFCAWYLFPTRAPPGVVAH
ncbi:major facilitator superfamily domain-containing protein [Mycena sp. CBHHK59/15]|nr:major facilitator superfamily domain-containing protein [Mycena sp. CBHHK59/15]